MKIAKFSPTTHVLFNAPAEGVPLELGISAWVQKSRIMGLLGLERYLTLSSAIWIQHNNVTDERTDGWTESPADSKDRAYAYRRAVKKIGCDTYSRCVCVQLIRFYSATQLCH